MDEQGFGWVILDRFEGRMRDDGLKVNDLSSKFYP